MNFKALLLTAAVVATGFAAAPANANNLPYCAEMENNEMPCVDNGRTYQGGAIDACYVDMGRSAILDSQCAGRIAQSQAKYSNQAAPANNAAFTANFLGFLNDASNEGGWQGGDTNPCGAQNIQRTLAAGMSCANAGF